MQAIETYRDVFSIRGGQYHDVMARWPQARVEELGLLPQVLGIAPGETLVDAPSGGGYVASLLAQGIEYVAVEPVDAFFDRCPTGGACSRVLTPLAEIGLPDGCADAVASLAGLHHEPDTRPIFAEFFRLLRPEGRLGIAEVAIDSPPDHFLNGFVDAHSSAGHRGSFFDPSIVGQLQAAGFEQAMADRVRLRWHFPDERDMTHFVRGLFGCDRATDTEIRDGIESILGTETMASGGIAMRWELLLATARKPGRRC